ncbi:hypothetical protein L3Q82_017917, partial [Scortum barcoo]
IGLEGGAKFLGVHILDDLTWTLNITQLVKKAHQRLYFLRRLRKFGMSQRTQRTFYTAIIESILTSCIMEWYGNSTAADRKHLQRVVRAAGHLPPQSPQESLQHHQRPLPPPAHTLQSSALWQEVFGQWTPVCPGFLCVTPRPPLPSSRLHHRRPLGAALGVKSSSGSQSLNAHEVCQELRGESSTFQLPEEEESLLILLYQVSCVHGPGQVRCDVDAQELDIVDTLNCFPVDEERSVLCPPGPPVVHYDLLGLAGVQNKVVV